MLQLTLVDGGTLVGDLLVPFLAGVLSVAFSFFFLGPMPKEEEKRKSVKYRKLRLEGREFQVIRNAKGKMIAQLHGSYNM